MRGGKELLNLSNGVEIRGCSFSPDGTFLSAALDNGRVEVRVLGAGG